MLFQYSLGLDIQDEQIAIACLQSSLRGIRLKAQQVKIFESDIDESERQRQVASIIDAFCADHKIATADLFIALPSNRLMSREIRLPAAVKENIRETLAYELEKYFPIPADKLYFDFQITHEDKALQQITVFLVAVRREVISATLQPLSELGMGVSGIEPRFTAMVSYHRLDPEIGKLSNTVFFVGDAHGCEMALTSGQQFIRCRRFDFNASAPPDMAEIDPWLLSANGDSLDPPSPLVMAIPPSAESHPVVRHMVDDRQVRLHPTRHPIVDDADAQTACAVGAALKGAGKATVDINVLPEKLRKPSSRIGIYTLLALSVLAIIAIVVWTGSWIAANRQFVSELDAELTRLKTDVTKVQELEQQADQIAQHINTINTALEQRISMLAIARELSREIPSNAWLRSLTFSEGSLRLEGYAESASELVSILEAVPMFTEVGFLSPITIDRNGKERFSIGLTVLK